MMRHPPLVLVLVSLGLGISAAEYLATSFSFRHWLGQATGRGDLQTLVRREGIYDRDVERAWASEIFATGAEPQQMAEPVIEAQKKTALARLTTAAKLNVRAIGQPIDQGALRRALGLLRWQFPDEKTFGQALEQAGLSSRALQKEVAAHLRSEAWLEASVAPQFVPNDIEMRQYYEAHLTDFQKPLRFRASHLFLAAPKGYPAEVIEGKRKLITNLSGRLAKGESFSVLVRQFSEDEATKPHDGDLGFFSESRMLPAVFTAVGQPRPGQISLPVRSRLGFHILHLTESRPTRQLTFEEARTEIETALANQKRTATVEAEVASLR